MVSRAAVAPRARTPQTRTLAHATASHSLTARAAVGGNRLVYCAPSTSRCGPNIPVGASTPSWIHHPLLRSMHAFI